MLAKVLDICSTSKHTLETDLDFERDLDLDLDWLDDLEADLLETLDSVPSVSSSDLSSSLHTIFLVTYSGYLARRHYFALNNVRP